jgi:hypothetical protein
MRTERWIELSRQPYEDDVWLVVLDVSDGEYRITQEFYTHPSDLVDLANRCRAFPQHRHDEVVFKLGSNDACWAYWVFLRAFLFDTAGHAAISIDVGTNGDELRRRFATFAIACDVASVNRFGMDLREWIEEPSEPMRTRLDVS